MKFTEHRDRDEAGHGSAAVEANTSLPAKSRTSRSAKGRTDRAGKAAPKLPDALPTNADGLRRCADKAGPAMPSASDGTDQSVDADKVNGRLSVPSPRKSRAGRTMKAVEAIGSLPVSAPPIDGGEEGRLTPADKAGPDLPASPSVDQLAELQVRRKFYISATNKQSNAVKALVRRALGWRYDEEEGDRDKVNGRAARIVAAALNGKEQKAEDAATFNAVAGTIAVVAQAIEPMQAARHSTELEMKKLAKKLPVYAWAKSVHGFGELGLSVIVAEAGDLAKYPKKGHLWKRLGLAVHEGKAYSTWRGIKGGLTAEQWTEAGYSPRRRAEVFAVISEPLFRAQSVVSGPYRAIYDRRREATAIAHADWTKAHSHMDALRVMTKYLIRDLWVAWRRAIVDVPERAGLVLPVAEHLDEREADTAVPPKAIEVMPLAHHPAE